MNLPELAVEDLRQFQVNRSTGPDFGCGLVVVPKRVAVSEDGWIALAVVWLLCLETPGIERWPGRQGMPAPA